MIDGLKIQPLSPDDLEVLSEFAIQVYFESYRGQQEIDDSELLKYSEQSFQIDQLRKEHADTNSNFFIATLNSVVIGYAKITFQSDDSLVHGHHAVFLSRLYTSARTHGTGVGKALLLHCIEASRRAVCDVMWLRVWEYSSRAIKFYKNNGFTVVGKAPFVLARRSYTDLVMERRL
jgi:ribosomal protein S18 acetylase RimI-like enzyme